MNYWNKISESFEILSQREKILIIVLGWGVVIFISLIFLIDPIMEKSNSEKNQLERINQSISTLKRNIELVNSQLKLDPNTEVKKERQILINKNLELKDKLAERMIGLVLPNEMAKLLEKVLSESAELTLVSMITLPSEKLIYENNTADYYIHPIQMVLRGTYFDFEAFLIQVESLPLKYYWRSFNYDVKKYPIAEVTIEVYTLGLSQDFIGG